MNCSNNNLLIIPYGNDFYLGVCRDKVAPANNDNVTFDDLTDISVYIVSMMGKRTEVDSEVVNGDLIVTIPADVQRVTRYSLEIHATYNEQTYRWKCARAFAITDSNCMSNVQGVETFGTETYWLQDDLTAEVVEEDTGETLMLSTHGLAYIEDGEVTLMADNAKLSRDGETLTIKNK